MEISGDHKMLDAHRMIFSLLLLLLLLSNLINGRYYLYTSLLALLKFLSIFLIFVRKRERLQSVLMCVWCWQLEMSAREKMKTLIKQQFLLGGHSYTSFDNHLAVKTCDIHNSALFSLFLIISRSSTCFHAFHIHLFLHSRVINLLYAFYSAVRKYLDAKILL